MKSKDPKDKPRVAVIGGYGGMGLFFAEIFARECFSVVISGPNEIAGRDAAKKIGAEYVKENGRAVKDADIVMISVPIHTTLEVIKEVAPHVRKGAVLLDVTSVKEKPCEYMDKYAPKGVEVIGTHPMFSQRVGSLEGQVFVLTPVRGEKWLSWLADYLKEHKAKVYKSTPEEHDHVMAVVQGLTHFTYISVGKTLEKLDFDVRASRKFSSPLYDLMLDMIGRIIGQSPELYASIQMENPEVTKVHDVFLETATGLASAVREKDEKTFIRTMKDAARHFDDLERAMGRSDKAIHSLVAEFDYLKGSVGTELCLRHIYSGKVHLGIVKSVTADTVTLEENGKRSELKISNIEILGDGEKARYKKERYGTLKRDYSVVFEEAVDEIFVIGLLCGFDENIAGITLKDVYRGKQVGAGKKSVCFAFELIDSNVKETEAKIKKFFSGIGVSFR